jgi:hypothetical protein
VHGDSDQIGFVVSCLFYQAINKDELHKWTYEVIKKYDELPIYIYDLAYFDEPLFHISKVIGFVPHWPFSLEDKQALDGIAYKRGVEPYDCPLTKEEALKKLEECPHIEKKFREIFPFIEF